MYKIKDKNNYHRKVVNNPCKIGERTAKTPGRRNGKQIVIREIPGITKIIKKPVKIIKMALLM